MFPLNARPNEKAAFQAAVTDLVEGICAVPEIKEYSYGYWAEIGDVEISWAVAENQLLVTADRTPTVSLSLDGKLPETNRRFVRHLLKEATV